MPAGDGSKRLQTLESKLRQEVKKEFFISVFFDGTWNKKTHTVSDTNVGVLSDLPFSGKQIKDGTLNYYKDFYCEGPGEEYEVSKEEERSILQKIVDFWYSVKPTKYVDDLCNYYIGGGFGGGREGVVAKVARIMREVSGYLEKCTEPKERQDVKIHFCVYGFSRGATAARLFSYYVARDADENECKTILECERALCEYLGNFFDIKVSFLKSFNPQNRVVEFLGLFDTVSSIGIKTKSNDEFLVKVYPLNVKDYGLYSPQLSNVKRTFHICAMEEYRQNFGITDVGKNVPPSCLEIFVPGSHSDVGGGNENGEFEGRLSTSKTFIVTGHPAGPVTEKTEITVESLKKLGWAEEENIIKEKKRNLKVFDYEVFDNSSITFKRSYKKGISNETMRMMWNRVGSDILQVWGHEPLNDYSQLSYIKNLTEGLLKVNVANYEYGKRYWVIPGGSLDSEQCVSLRRTYAYFSAYDSFSSIFSGKRPTWRDNLLTRNVYHGDKNDYGVYCLQDYNRNISTAW